MSDDPGDPKKIADEERRRWLKKPKHLESAGATRRMKALQQGFRNTRADRSRRTLSLGRLGKVAGLLAMAALIVLSLWIILFDRGGPLAPKSSSSTARTMADFKEEEPKGVYYRRCDDARADGVAPIKRGQPGYRRGLDADGDGIACEPLIVN